MDTITQAVLGAAIAEAGWRHKLGPKAIAFGTFCGLLPDFDVVAGIMGPWASLEHHRGLTHSLFFAPVVSAPLAWLGWMYAKRKGKVRQWSQLAFWALITHPLLDVFTSYGTQLLWPISRERFSLDGVSIIDPMYTFPLMISLLIAYVYRAKPAIGKYATRLFLLATTAYLFFGHSQSLQAKSQAQIQLQGSGPITKIRATPTFANVFVWRVMVKDEWGNIKAGYTSTLKDESIQFETKKRAETPLISKALQDERGKLYYWFTGGWLTYKTEATENGGTRLFMEDQRYGSIVHPTQPMWWAEADFDAEGELIDLRSERGEGRKRMDFREEINTLWGMLTN